ncbi:MAG: SDR family oxidoreductase [Bacillota bacterium]
MKDYPKPESDVAPAPNIERMEQREACVERLYHEERLAAGQMAERTAGGGASMVTVTGATGHIGNVLVRDLLARAQRVRALIPPCEDPAPLDGLNVEKVEGDILDVGSLVRAFKGSDVVYHLAGIVSIVPGKRDLLYRVNVVGTKNVVEACLEAGVSRLVYTSSIHAIAEPPSGVVIDESLPFDPDRMEWEYDESKALATLEVLKAKDKGLDSVVLCPTGVVGPYDFRPSEMGQLFINYARRSMRVYIDGAYDFVDVRDVACGHVLACDKGGSGETYILSGERVTVLELMQMLERVTGVRAPRLKVPVWQAQSVAALAPLYSRLTGRRPLLTSYSVRTLQRNSFVSNAKARRELGYSPRPLYESVADTIKWFKDTGRL